MWCNNAEFGLNLSWEILKSLWYTKGINNARWCIFNRSIQSNGVYSNFDTPQQPYLWDIPCLVLTAYLKWNLTGSGYMDWNILFLHKARILHHNTTMVQSQIDKSSQKSPQKLPKRAESLCHIDVQPSEQRLYTRMPELSHLRGTNWREVSLCIWSLSWFGRSFLLYEGSLHDKVVSSLAMFCFTLWFDRIPCAFYCFALLFLMSFLWGRFLSCGSVERPVHSCPWQGSRILFSWRVKCHFWVCVTHERGLVPWSVNPCFSCPREFGF